MPWTTDYLTAGAHIAFSGLITGDDIFRAKAEAYTREYESGLRFVVLDYEAVEDFDVDRGDVDRTVTQDRAAARGVLPDLSVVAIAPQPAAYGVARLWEAQMGSTGWRTSVVRSRAEAFDWLAKSGIPTEDLPAVLD